MVAEMLKCGNAERSKAEKSGRESSGGVGGRWADCGSGMPAVGWADAEAGRAGSKRGLGNGAGTGRLALVNVSSKAWLSC